MDKAREAGLVLNPKYDANGLICAVVTNVAGGVVLMVGFMDAEALAATRATGTVHFHSRSRGKLWQKGESSGHFLHVVEMRIDCDQDAIWIIAKPDGPTCHTGERSCFYRRIGDDGLEQI
jgi:phosphoribosyl-AMP cyclohydrolase